MKCPQCELENKKSCVYPGVSMTTCAYYSAGHYDENGNWVNNPYRNTTTTEYTCSNNHKWLHGE